MNAEQVEPLPREMFLALFAVPSGVRARNEALDADLTLLGDIDKAVRDELGGETAPGDLDARVLFAVHLVARVAVSLIEGARLLLPSNAYAASALVRQLVEVEYLAWACGHDSAEAVDWLTSDREARLKRWSPQRLRNRSEGRFDDQDYWNHCEAGGHPTALGILTLLGPSEAHPELVVMPEVTLYEIALHATAITDYVSHAVPSDLAISEEAKTRAHAAAFVWREGDPAASWSRLTSADESTRAAMMLDLAVLLAEGASELG